MTNKQTTFWDFLTMVCCLAYYAFIIGGSSYIIFWKHHSPLWFILTYFLLSAVKFSFNNRGNIKEEKKDATN